MLRRARWRAASGSPLWTWRAPQQPWLAGTRTRRPLRARTRMVASCVCGWVRGMTQPTSRAAVARAVAVGSMGLRGDSKKRRGRGGGGGSGRRRRAGAAGEEGGGEGREGRGLVEAQEGEHEPQAARRGEKGSQRQRAQAPGEGTPWSRLDQGAGALDDAAGGHPGRSE